MRHDSLRRISRNGLPFKGWYGCFRLPLLLNKLLLSLFFQLPLQLKGGGGWRGHLGQGRLGLDRP